MKIAFVGCGYVADLYARTFSLHPSLELAGVVGRDPERGRRFSAHWSAPRYESLEQFLADRTVDIAVNLTGPNAYYQVSRAGSTRSPVGIPLQGRPECAGRASWSGWRTSRTRAGIPTS